MFSLTVFIVRANTLAVGYNFFVSLCYKTFWLYIIKEIVIKR